MIRNDFCIINEHIPRRHRRTNTQFVRHIIEEADRSKAVRAHEILMTSENPMIKEQKRSDQICSELKKVEQEKFLEEKRKVLLHQNEDEIRELDVQIKRAHTQRELVEQKAFNENKIKKDLQARAEENKRYAEEYKQNIELALREEIESAHKKAALRQDLLKQMEERNKQREREREIISKERANRQKYLQSMQKDIENEKRQELELKQMLRTDRDEYLQNVKLYKSREQFHAEEDHRRHMEMMNRQEEEKILRKKKREQAMQKRAAVSERIGQQLLSIKLEKQKHSDLLLELLIEERLAKDDKRYKQNLENQMKRARSLLKDFQDCLTERQQEKLLRRQEEKHMTQGQLTIFEKHQEIENNMAELEQLKTQYRQDLLETIKYKNLQRDFEAAENKNEYEQQLAVQKKRQQEIEDEKLRLLRAAPLKNLKFLPPKAISQEHRIALGFTCKETKEKND